MKFLEIQKAKETEVILKQKFKRVEINKFCKTYPFNTSIITTGKPNN
jgi:hypothetical protein